MKKFWLVACLFMGLVAFAQDMEKAGERVLLRYKFVKGDARTYKAKQVTKTGMSGQSGGSESEVVTVETIDSVDGGAATVTQETKSMKMSINMGEKSTSFDSTKKEDIEKAKSDPMLAPTTNMLGKSVSYKVTEKGEVVDVYLKAGDDSETMKSIAEGIKNGRLSLPDKQVAKGDKWSGFIETGARMHNMGKLKMTYTCEFAGVKDLDGEKCAVIKVKFDKFEIVGVTDSSMKMQIGNSDGSGVFYLSLDKGIRRKSEMKTSYDMKIDVEGDKSMTMHFETNSNADYVK